ncbi:hypothetical protein HanIR_Chr08g0366161 [Helianthus annuus]|nr:hypothetical protein HanIR_Chr08g0366161 [Helianthus annuus]
MVLPFCLICMCKESIIIITMLLEITCNVWPRHSHACLVIYKFLIIITYNSNYINK